MGGISFVEEYFWSLRLRWVAVFHSKVQRSYLTSYFHKAQRYGSIPPQFLPEIPPNSWKRWVAELTRKSFKIFALCLSSQIRNRVIGSHQLWLCLEAHVGLFFPYSSRHFYILNVTKETFTKKISANLPPSNIWCNIRSKIRAASLHNFVASNEPFFQFFHLFFSSLFSHYFICTSPRVVHPKNLTF